MPDPVSRPAFAYRFADPGRYDALYERLRPETLAWLRDGTDQPPPAMLEWLCTHQDRSLATALAARPWLPGNIGFLLRLVRTGSPGLFDAPVRELVRSLTRERPGWARDALGEAVDRVLTALFEVADPADAAWRAPDGLVEFLAVEPFQDGEWTALLAAPFPGLVSRALRALGPDLDPTARLAACRMLTARSGAAALAAVADAAGDLGDDAAKEENVFGTELTRHLREAAAAPDPLLELDGILARFGARMPPLGSPLAPLARLRYSCRSADEDLPDGEAVLREHRRRPLPGRVLVRPALRPGCPVELLLAAYADSPREFDDANWMPWEALDVPHEDRESRQRLRTELLRRGMAAGWYAPERVFKELSPALDALTAVHGYDADLPEEVERALADLVAPLGTDPAAWARTYTRLPRFKGSCTELVTEAAAFARSDPTPSWPRRIEASEPHPVPDGARAALNVLLAAAPPQATAALAPHLDPRAVQDLLVHGRTSKASRDHLLAVHGKEAALAWASSRHIMRDGADCLLAMDDPDINARLFRYGPLTRTDRVRVLAGIPHGVGRTDDVPISDELAEVMLGGETGQMRPWLLAAVESGDPRLVRIMLGRVKPHTEAARLWLVVRLWERHGPDEVRRLLGETTFPTRRTPKHPLPPADHKTIEAALARGPIDGAAQMRAAHAHASAPATLTAGLLRRPWSATKDRIERIEEEIGSLPWDELVATQRAEGIPAEVLAGLARLDDCPDELLLALLRAAPLDGHADSLVNHGRIPVEAYLRHGRPAAVVVRSITKLSTYRPDGRPHSDEQTLAALIRADLGIDPETWAVAARILPDFDGTVPELLSTVRAITA